MVSEQFKRLELVYGTEAIEKLMNSHVAVFGVGGVGGHVVEALARCGIGKLDLIDKDTVDITNLNRQMVALHSTIGMDKVDVAKQRVLDINPDCEVTAYKTFFLPETSDMFDFSKYDYVVDAIDTVTAKIELVTICKKTETPIISAMGAGNKIKPSMFEIEDISKTSYCPLAKVMRRELHKRGINHLKVVYSKEEPIKNKEGVPGSTAFTPSVMGLIMAGEVINDITGMN